MKSRSLAVLFVFFASIFACCAFGQTFRGSIQGTVTDTSGALVVGAQVKVFSPDTGLSRTVTTNDQGEYLASELPLGTYSVTIEKEGFRTTTLNQIPVSVGSPARADAKLTTGQVKEMVEVNADVPLVETTTNTTGGTIDAAEVAELPVNGRDFTKLLELVPGTTSDPVGSTESAGSYGLFSSEWQSRPLQQLSARRHGHERRLPQPALDQPGRRLGLSLYDSSGRCAGRDSGHRQSRGRVWPQFRRHGQHRHQDRHQPDSRQRFRILPRRRAWARATSSTPTDQPKNSFTNHQFGGSVGGPIVKDKSFWLIAYEGQRENGGLPQLGTVPTQADIATAIAALRRTSSIR